MGATSCFIIGGSWHKSPIKIICNPPKRLKFPLAWQQSASMVSKTSGRSIDTSSMMRMSVFFKIDLSFLRRVTSTSFKIKKSLRGKENIE